MKPQEALEAIDTLYGQIDPEEQGAFKDELAARFGLTALNGANETGPTTSFASETVWQTMSPEQRTKASELRSALATGRLKELGVTEDSLRVVATEKDGKKQFTLIHTGNGLDIGDSKKEYDKTRSYTAVMSKKNNTLFQVKVGGVNYDTRRGMTDEVYDAKVADARERGVTLPDSKQLSNETGDDWTWTMLTGEPLTADGDVQIRSVGEGELNGRWSLPGNGYRR